MATILSQENISQARAAVTNYRNTCDGLFKQVSAEILKVTGSSFIGDAATGYLNFFDQIKPALSTNLTGTDQSVTSLMDSLLNVIEQMLNPIDPQLGNANKNAAGQGAAAAVGAVAQGGAQ